MTLRVVFAEDNYLVREGTSALLQEIDQVEVVAAVEDLDSLIQAVEEHQPDVVLTDIKMPPTHTMEGIEAARQIRAAHPQIGVLVLSQHADDEYAHEVLKEGAGGLGYLLKERVSHIDQLSSALHEVARGGSVLDPKIVEGLVRRKEAERASLVPELTDREKGVLELMAQGKTNAAIAKELFLSERAVEKYISAIFQKLQLAEESDVNRRVLAVVTYLRETGSDRRTERAGFPPDL